MFYRGGKILFESEDIPSKLIPFENSIQVFHAEIELRNKNRLLYGSYNPNRTQINGNNERLNTSLAFNPSKYHDFFVMGEFNVGKVDDIFFYEVS